LLGFAPDAIKELEFKGQVIVRYFGFYANAHRAKVSKSEEGLHKLLIPEGGGMEDPPLSGLLSLT
jgi:hypothetical protein